MPSHRSAEGEPGWYRSEAHSGDEGGQHPLPRFDAPLCRPALVVSKDLFNRHTGLCLACPITSTRRDHPFHVALPDDAGVTGAIMVEQVKSVDYRARKVRRIGQVPSAVLDEALAILDACVY